MIKKTNPNDFHESAMFPAFGWLSILQPWFFKVCVETAEN
jgi:hypothetical protein